VAKSRSHLTGFVSGVAAVIVVCGCTSPASAPRFVEDWTTAPPGATASLGARVTFDAMQLAVENRDTRTWTSVVIEVRRAGSAEVYRFSADVIVGGRTLPVGALNFAAADGRRMSPFEGAPSEWRIHATLPDGSRGWASGTIVEVAPP
jgi:hypothetical protein